MSLIPLDAYSAPLAAIAAVFGLAIGSFLNVVIHRLPKMLERQWQAECAELRGEAVAAQAAYNVVVPRSACPRCGHMLAALENIPLISYLALGGKCSACKARISPRYPAVEVIAGALSGYIAWRYGISFATAGALILAWSLLAAAFIDFDTFVLPDDITLPLLWCGLLFNIPGTFIDLRSAVIGAVAGYLVLWLVFWAFKWATGKEGMGYGDFKLLAAAGAWLGWQMLPAVILLASFVGAAIGIALIVIARRGRNVPIPFGPYLAVATLVALFWGDAIVEYYLGIF